MGLVHLWVVSYGRVAIVFAIALCLGYPVCRKIVRGAAAPAVALLAGLALFSLAVCLFSWLGIFSGWAVIVLAIVAAAASARCVLLDLAGWRERLRVATRPGLTTISCFAVLVVVLFGFSLFVLYPSTAFDATSYHLPLARDLVRHQGLVYDPFIRYSFFPQANEAMFAVMLLLTGNPVASAALEYSVLSVAVLLLPLWFVGSGRRVGGGFVAGILVLASPVVIFAGTAAFVDAWTLTFVLAGLLVALDAAEGRAPALATLILAGALFGEASATKYTGAGYAVIAMIGVAVSAGRSRAFWSAVPGALAGGAVIALPWYLWTIHTTGDPVYPIATSIFGNRHGLWTVAELKAQKLGERGGVPPGIGAVIKQDVRYLRGLVPYETGPHRSPLSWLLGLGVMGLLHRSGWRDRTFLGVALAAVLSVVVSLLASANPRYLVPAIGFFALGAGLTADSLIGAVGRVTRIGLPRSLLASALCVVWAVIGLWTSVAYVRDFRRDNGDPPTTRAGIVSYLSARIPCYAAAEWLNGNGGKNYRAWGYACEEAHYYANARLIGDAFSVGSRLRIFNDSGNALPSDRTLWRRLRALDVQWAILPTITVPRPSVLQAHGLFRLVAQQGPMDIFRVIAAPAP